MISPLPQRLARRLASAPLLCSLVGVASGQTPILTEHAVLTAANGGAFHEFGSALAVDGDRAAVAASTDDTVGFDAGAVRTFHFASGVWTQDQLLIPADVGDQDEFGFDVGLSGTTLVCGARFDDDADNASLLTNSGAVYVFDHDGATWNETIKLLAPDPEPGDEFGRSVAIDGDRLAVGALYEDSAAPDAGAVYVFRRIGGTWSFQAKLTATNAASGDSFGIDLALSGGTLVVGAIGRSTGGTILVYRELLGSWLFDGEFGPLAAEAGEDFGAAVALDGNRLAVGAPSGADGGRVVLLSDLIGLWTVEHELAPPDLKPGQDYGAALDIDGKRLVVGAPFALDIPATEPGCAYAYDWSGSQCDEVWKLQGSDALPGDAVGTTVAVSGCSALVGAPLWDDVVASVGVVLAYRVYDPVVTYCQSKVNSQGCAGAMGWSGAPDLATPDPFELLGNNILNQKQGLLFYGITGIVSTPFLGGTLCVTPPLQRSPVLYTGGNFGLDDCTGVLSFDFAAWTLGGNDASLGAYIPVAAQYWYRDPSDFWGSCLTDGVSFTLIE